MKTQILSTLAIFTASSLQLAAQQPSPMVVRKTIASTSDLILQPAPMPYLKLEINVPGSTPTATPLYSSDLSIGMFDGGSFQSGIFELSKDGAGGGWSWQRRRLSGNPRVEMDLQTSGKLTLFGANSNSIVLRPTGDVGSYYPGQGPAGVFVNGSRLVSEVDLANSVIPEIQSYTLQADAALSIGQVYGILGTGSMAAGAGASVWGAGSLAFGAGAHVGGPMNPQGQIISGEKADDAVALGNNANARAKGAMAFGTRANAGTRQSIAIGEDSVSTGGNSIYWAGSTYEMGSVAVGTKARATGTASSALGVASEALGGESVAIGPMARATATASVSLGWAAYSDGPGSLAFGAGTRAYGLAAVAIGNVTYATATRSVAIGNYTEATGAGMMSLGTAPDFTGLTQNENWDDMNSVVFIVGGGKPGEYIGGGGAWLSNFAITRRTSLSVTRGGDLKASGKVEASKLGGLLVPDTLEAKGGITRLWGRVIIERQGDISMGEFLAGPQP
jgi:hypothetical protein